MAQHCVHCGAEVYDEGNFCHVCGKSKAEIPSGSGKRLKAVVLPPDDERIFFQDGAVTVTNRWFRVPGQNFPMSDVSAASMEKSSTTGSWPTVMYLLGLGSFLARLYRFGFMLLIAGAVLRMIFIPKFSVVLDSASGDLRAFTGGNRDYVSEIVDALNKAIAYNQ